MSNLIFPTLRGFLPDIEREQIDQIAKQEALSGKEWRSTWRLSPKYRYRVSFGAVRNDTVLAELQAIAGFYTRHRGPLDSFLFQDLEDYTVTGHAFGVGNGSATAFQLQRTFVPTGFLAAPASRAYWPAFADGYEPVVELGSVPAIYKAGALQTGGGTNYTLGVDGAVTFTVAPAAGAVLTWDGTFWRRVRFAGDSLPLTRIVPYLWSAKSIELVSVVGGGGNIYTPGIVTPPPPGVYGYGGMLDGVMG